MFNGKDLIKKLFIRVLVAIMLVIVASVFIFQMYKAHVQKSMTFSSRYTYSVNIDSEGNIIESSTEESSSESDESEVYDFTQMSSETVANAWIKSFLSQFTGIYVPNSKKLKNVSVSEVYALDEASRTCFISFSAKVASQSSEYFSTWDGVTLNGKLTCEWVVTFSVVDHYNNTATVYVTALQTPEDYGIAQYDESIQNSASTTTVTSTQTDELSSYHISNSILYVSYNGSSSYVVVPVDIDKLIYDEDDTDKTLLLSTSYMISQTKTAFVYGGKTVNNSAIPLTVIFSDDKGSSWTTCELSSDIDDVDFVYVYFTDADNGFIVAGYDTSADESSQSAMIFKTEDGGNSWSEMGSGPLDHPIKGVLTTDSNTIFVCYYYNENYISNLYVSYDGGASFSNIIFEDQELDSSAASSGDTILTWSDVYKDALVPILDDDSELIVYLTQVDAVYNDGKTAAKYVSTNNGLTWEYIGQLEINVTE